MRSMIAAAFVFALAACSGEVSISDNETNPSGGYTLEVRASEAEQAYLVTAPDGRVVGARASDGQSALLDAQGLQHFAQAPDVEPIGQELVVLRVPGLDLSVRGDPEGTGESGGGVNLSIGGRNLEVNADEGGPGESDDRAQVRINGASEADVRNFITKADQLSPAVQAEMLAALGLE